MCRIRFKFSRQFFENNMESITLIRIIKTSWTNFWRNILLSTAATLVMATTLTILTVTFLIYSLTNVTAHSIQQKVDVSAYMKSQVSETQILAVKDEISNIPNVEEVQYISAAQALQNFKQKHAQDQLIQESLSELDSNPLPATLDIKAKNLSDYPAIAQALSDPKYQQYIASVNFEDNRPVIEKLSKILRITREAGIALAIVFGLIAVLVIFNTIRLTIYNRKEEVEIMKLVGATNWYIRWPFIIESVFYGITASVITLLLMIPVFQYALPKVGGYLGISGSAQSILPFGIGLLFVWQLAIALILGIFSSLFAIRKYLKV